MAEAAEHSSSRADKLVPGRTMVPVLKLTGYGKVKEGCGIEFWKGIRGFIKERSQDEITADPGTSMRTGPHRQACQR